MRVKAQLLSLGGDVHVKVSENGLRFRGGLVCKAHRLFVSLNSRLESNKEEEEETWCGIIMMCL